MVVRNAQAGALDDLVAVFLQKADGALMDFRQIRRGQRNLARLHLLQGRERGGGRRGDLRPRHPLPQLLNQRLVVGGAVQERGAGSAEQQHVDGGRAGQARGLFEFRRVHHFLDALHGDLRQLDACGMGGNPRTGNGPHLFFHHEAGGDVDQPDAGKIARAVVAESGVGGG
ncbi:hypothetical protein G6F57_021277 [Rhizopus arrhizus]|nr:hypothetical protein G6F57_021277 [Rhizopus arrhizus]